MDKVCYNGKYLQKSKFSLSVNNRSFKYGDGFFETIRCLDGEPLFWEEHYFRIAASFSMMQMTVPDIFDLDNFKELIQRLLFENNLEKDSARIRISFFRSEGGYYLPESESVEFIIESKELHSRNYELNIDGLNVGLYRQNYLVKSSFSKLKSTNRLLNVLAAIYCRENYYDDSLLFNHDNHIVESVSGNVFISKDNTIYTPQLEDGCIDGVMRRILLNKTFPVKEKSISLSEVLNAEEVFLTNVISGVKWVERINNTRYKNSVSAQIVTMLNNDYLI